MEAHPGWGAEPSRSADGAGWRWCWKSLSCHPWQQLWGWSCSGSAQVGRCSSVLAGGAALVALPSAGAARAQLAHLCHPPGELQALAWPWSRLPVPPCPALRGHVPCWVPGSLASAGHGPLGSAQIFCVGLYFCGFLLSAVDVPGTACPKPGPAAVPALQRGQSCPSDVAGA